MLKNTLAVNRWKHVKVLIIDEGNWILIFKVYSIFQIRRCSLPFLVSMLSAALFDSLSAIAAKAKGNDLPFGGIQIILCGDFFQLPPVSKPRSPAKLCFFAEKWSSAVKHYFLVNIRV